MKLSISDKVKVIGQDIYGTVVHVEGSKCVVVEDECTTLIYRDYELKRV